MAEYDVVLVPSFTQAENWRKNAAAAAEGGLFAQTVTTFNAWIADLWELHGDGRSLVDHIQRRIIMQAAFDQMEGAGADDGQFDDLGAGADNGQFDGLDDFQTPADQDAFPDGASEMGASGGVLPGVVKLACQFVRSAAGVHAFEQVVSQARTGAVPAGLSDPEAALLRGIGCYQELLEEAGLVELGSAAALLAQQAATVFPRPLRVLLDQAAPPDWRMQQFFGECRQLTMQIKPAMGASGMGRVPAPAKLRFAFPSGRYAQPALVADLVREMLADQSVESGESPADVAGPYNPEAPLRTSTPARLPVTVVTCKSPLSLYAQIEDALSLEGVLVSVQALVPFSSTDFGKRFMALASVIADEWWSKEDLSDAILPPFAGIGADDVLLIDKTLRADRLAEREQSLMALRQTSDLFSQFEELASDPEADILLGVFEQIAFSSPKCSDAWRAEQLSAAAALRACTKAARRVGANMSVCLRVLQDVRVRVSFKGTRADVPCTRQVLVTTQDAAAQMGVGSCSQLIVCDLTAQDYPLAAKEDSADTLFAKLGLTPPDTPLARARRTFWALMRLASDEVVCTRPLNDWDGTPTYPAAVLQELVDAYREDPTSDDDIDRLYGLPAELREGMVQRGEELLFANATACAASETQPVDASVLLRSLGYLTQKTAGFVALPRRLPDGRVLPGFSPSPSQVEMYLECPHKWFVQNRLKVEELDENFGPLERGTFFHSVLQEFYRRFQEQGFLKVNEDNLAQARELMAAVAAEMADQQYSMPPSSGRYVAINQIEKREVDACIAQLQAYLDFESRFLPTFHPAYLEYAITPEDGMTYAGHTFVGTVDRVDVDDCGRAVVVDYKGSIGDAYEIHDKTADQPGKVQTRMYAQVVKRKLGLNVVGALYVSYGKSSKVCGAYDPCALEAPHLPGMRHEKCSCAVADDDRARASFDFQNLTFSTMLDATEELAARAMQAMELGQVEPAPVSADACKYCVVANCPKRGE